MRLLPAFILRIVKAAARSEAARGKMSIVVRRSYDYLKEELQQTFGEQDDVEVIVDRRTGERRRAREPLMIERRRADRRCPTEEIVEVVIRG